MDKNINDNPLEATFIAGAEPKIKAYEDALEKIIKKVGEADKIREKIEGSIKDLKGTAQGIAINDAQEKLRADNIWLLVQTVLWGVICAGTVIFIYNFAMDLIRDDKVKELKELKDLPYWLIIYKLVIRISIFTMLGSVSAFCFKMFRSTLHMYQYNVHRRRLTNSLPAYLAATSDETKKDAILTSFVEVICKGNTGILSAKEIGEELTPIKELLKVFPKTDKKE